MLISITFTLLSAHERYKKKFKRILIRTDEPVLVVHGGGGLIDGGVGYLWGPGYALHHVVMVSQLTSTQYGIIITLNPLSTRSNCP